MSIFSAVLAARQEAEEAAPVDEWGGNPLEMNVNEKFVGVEYQAVYIAFCSIVVWPIIPGIGFLYSGLSRRKSSVALLFQSFMVAATITFQWMFWGYSLTYSKTAGPFIGDLANFGLRGVMSGRSGDLPEILFCFYQLLFCAATVQIVIGGAFERGRIIPSIVFGFCWATVVYCPIACWTWNANGWLYNLPSLDFAGGGPVHIASGCSALAYALVLGKRKVTGAPSHKKAHNVTLVFLGTVLIWFGWFGFNGGSTLGLSVRSLLVIFNTNAAASAGILGWVLVDYVKHGRRFSIVGACEGAIAGLVGITPAAGYVSPWISFVIGILTGAACALLENVDSWLGIDEGMDVFKLHGVGGMVGSFLTGIFATSKVSMLDGVTEASGALDGVGVQVGRQLADICAVSIYSFVVSCILLLILKYIPGLHLRITDEAEEAGLDRDQFFGEEIGDTEIFEEIAKRGLSTDAIVGHTPNKGSSIDQAQTETKKAD
ncbi:ammonium transporter AmtB-like domain-containing protein [Podospora aff. communis PSN243]|uniref:Ammonium transporter n=1 Tax=Podospora aff. communis PSN243 TaxID=3040156 RepID=A0AAV9GN27_9PEZI|nr:ammonium transporter AmtB-like domain-containing protein [Podospora aff. communis PSN243]